MKNLDRTFKGYKILHRIHEKDNLSIYRAEREADGQTVILKIKNPDSSTDAEWNLSKQEYDIICKLKKVEGVIRAYGMEIEQQSLVIILEDFGGESLKLLSNRRMATGQGLLPLDEFLDIAIRITQVLNDIHAAHVVHNDLNSSNIIYNQDSNQVKIAGFHISSTLSRKYPAFWSSGRIEDSLAYISPEQTGRMNRAVDYRSDLYSLGVTFYEMLTGCLPFENNDPLSLVHAHIAKIPKPVAVVNPNVPLILSEIIMRLLAKDAEDRYQSAYGLKADLERCLFFLKSGAITEDLSDFHFELGRDDYSEQFHIPQKLYGRSSEIAHLIDAYEETASGNQEVVLISGYAGVGKSALAAELHKTVTEKHGHFVSGKFDQYQQNTPYMAFIQAFVQFAELILTESEGVLQQWRKKILSGVGDNGSLLTEVMPGLEKIIGIQPDLPVLSGIEIHNRFNLTFHNFIQAISTSEQPLVVFIDNWQWADLASLELLNVLLTGDKIQHFLLIGAYRDNELDQAHSLMMTLRELTAGGAEVQTINLSDMRQEDVRELVHESLSGSSDESRALADLVYEKTRGNAFFTLQFLQNLYEEGWLQFDFANRRWTWDMAKIEAQQISDNVADLMAGKLEKISSDTAKLLQLAACIGNEFDIKTLAMISKMKEVPVSLREFVPEHKEEIIDLDIFSIMKASQAISGRIILEELLIELMKIVIENAGAQWGCLLLRKGGRWIIEAEGTADKNSMKTLQGIEIEQSDALCLSIVRYVTRSNESVVLEDAFQKGLFVDDLYIKQKKIRSVICSPLSNRGKLIGIIYLENNLAADTFTPERIKILELLAGQAAVALENAMFYQQAQKEIDERKTAEEALKESEERFKTIFDSVNDAIFVHDAITGDIVDVNEKMCMMFGYTHEEALKIQVKDINSDEPNYTEKEGLAYFRKTIEEGQQLFEWRAKDKNGRLFWIEVNMRRASIGDQERILVVARDINERKHTETQLKHNLRETQIRYEVSRALAAAETEDEVLDIIIQQSGLYPEALVTICTFDSMENGRDVILRRQHDIRSGLTVKLKTGTRLPFSTFTTFDLFRPDQPFFSNDIYKDDRIDEATMEIFRQSGVISEASFPLSIGNEWLGFIGVLSKQPDFFDDEKQHLYQTLADQGAVAFRAAHLRETIRESQQRLSLFVRQSPLGVIEWDNEFRIASWNPAAEHIFGYSREEALGCNADIIVPEQARTALAGIWNSLINQTGGTYSENANITKNGKQIICEWFNAPLADSGGNIIGVASLVLNITERKLAEKELSKHREHLEELVRERTGELEAAQEELLKRERLSVLGQLTATVSHELRNPLGVIRSSAFYLKEKIKISNEKIRKHLNRIEFQVDLCNWIVEELLEYTRGSSSEMKEGNIIPCIATVLDDVSGTEGILITRNFNENMPKIFFDPAKLGRVITNLVNNAAHAVHERMDKEKSGNNIFKPEIQVSASPIDNGAGIVIEDNGSGMDENTLKKAFEPLFTTKARGTGLGLAIVKKIVEEHNGRIEMKSKVRRGTMVSFWLPAVKNISQDMEA